MPPATIVTSAFIPDLRNHFLEKEELTSGTHGSEASLSIKAVIITKRGLLRIAVRRCNAVTGDARDGRLRVGDHDAILDVEALDLGERGSDELGDDGEDFSSVDCEARAVEARVAHAIALWHGKYCYLSREKMV